MRHIFANLISGALSTLRTNIVGVMGFTLNIAKNEISIGEEVLYVEFIWVQMQRTGRMREAA